MRWTFGLCRSAVILLLFPVLVWAEQILYVNTDCEGTSGDGSVVTCGNPTGAADSCYEGVQLIPTTLTEDVTIYFSGTNPDNSYYCDPSGKTTTGYTVKLEGDPSNPEGVNATGVWSEDHYYITNGSYSGPMQMNIKNLTIKNLQIESTCTEGAGEICPGILFQSSAGGTNIVEGNLIRNNSGDPSTSGSNIGVDISSPSTSGDTWSIGNNAIYGFQKGIRVQTDAGQNAYVYNNTVDDCGTYGIEVYGVNSTDTIKLRNNIVQDCGTDYVSNGAPATLVTQKTITLDATSPDSDCGAGGSSSCASTTVTFTGASDYHTTDTDVAARGADLDADGDYAITDDFEGDARHATTPYIGADEGAAAATPTPTPTATATNTGTHTPTSTPTATSTPAGGGGGGTVDVDRDGVNSDGTQGTYAALTTSTDCDDADPMVYEGIYVGCDAGGGANTGHKVCQNAGTYGSCVDNDVTPLCEKTGSGSCYYVDCDAGSDAAAGSYVAPWATPRNVSYYASGAPATHVGNLAAGDVLYVWGTCTTSQDTNNYLNTAWLAALGQDGTSGEPIIVRNYPGKAVTIDPAFNPATEQYNVFHIFRSSYWKLIGLDVSGGGASGIRFSTDSTDTNCIAEACTIHDNDGNGNNNPAGISFGTMTDSEVHHSKIYDNYNITGGGNSENTHNVYLTAGTGNDVHHNSIYYSATTGNRAQSYNIKYKVGTTTITDTFTARYNYIQNGNVGIGTAQAGSHIHHNIFHGQLSEGIEYRDLGNVTCFDDFLAEYNTFMDTEPMQHEPWSEDCAGNFLYTFRYNVVEDNQASVYTSGNAFAGICNSSGSCPNSVYTTLHTGGKFAIDSNCYFNNQGQTELWDFFEGGESSGDMYTWADWNTLGYDGLGFVEDPQLNVNHEAQSANCDTWGWILPVAAGATPTPTPTSTPTATSTNTPVNTPTPAAASRPQGVPLLRAG